MTAVRITFVRGDRRLTLADGRFQAFEGECLVWGDEVYGGEVGDWDAANRAAYVAEMRASYRRHRDAWREIAARALVSDVALVCFCGDPARCHRSVAAELLVAAAPRLLDGATLEYIGEAERVPRARPASGFVCTRGRGKGCHAFGPPPGPWSDAAEVERTADLVPFPGAPPERRSDDA